MSSRPQLNPSPVIGKVDGMDSGISGDMSTTITSKVTIIQKLSMVSYAFTWTGATGSGVVTIQVSNDYELNAQGGVENAGTWNTLPMSAAGTVTGASGVGFADVDQNAGYALRAIYTPSGSTGQMTCTVCGKVT
jgi:hypothetical protein